MNERRIGVLGGSFDPVHEAHLELARRGRDQLDLDDIWLLPAGIPPHKDVAALTAVEHRLAMLRLAMDDEPRMSVCTFEIDRPGVHYSWQTLTELRRLHPQARFFFLMGEDSLLALGSWSHPADLVRLAVPVVCPRPGFGGPRPARVYGVAIHWLSGEELDLSSSALRERLGRGERPEGMDPAVLAYIDEHGLYRGDNGS